MTLYGIDISNHQSGVDLHQVAAEGFSWVEAKVSEGNYYRDPTWAANYAAAQTAGLPIIGYHYANGSCSPASQVAAWQANAGGGVCMIDFEDNSGTIDDYWALVDAFDNAGVTVALTYLPRWYWQQIGSPDLSQMTGLVASNYPHADTGWASTLYVLGGGDAGIGWEPYGGASPLIWQFTDRATVAGISVDANAFRGSASELAALIGGNDMTPQQVQQLQDIWDQLRGPNGHGWPQLGQDAAGNDRTVVDAIGALITTVDQLSAEVAALKGTAST